MEILRQRLIEARLRYSRMRSADGQYGKARAISRTAASELMGLPPRAIAQYEAGERCPSAESLAKIARFYSVSADYLLGLTNNPGR